MVTMASLLPLKNTLCPPLPSSITYFVGTYLYVAFCCYAVAVFFGASKRERYVLMRRQRSSNHSYGISKVQREYFGSYKKHKHTHARTPRANRFAWIFMSVNFVVCRYTLFRCCASYSKDRMYKGAMMTTTPTTATTKMTGEWYWMTEWLDGWMDG